jgi:hypothetical protein
VWFQVSQTDGGMVLRRAPPAWQPYTGIYAVCQGTNVAKSRNTRVTFHSQYVENMWITTHAEIKAPRRFHIGVFPVHTSGGAGQQY